MNRFWHKYSIATAVEGSSTVQIAAALPVNKKRRIDYRRISRILRLIAVGVPNKTKAGCAVVLDLGLVLGHFLLQVPCPFHFTTGFSHDQRIFWTAIRTYHDPLWINNNISCQTTIVQQVHTNSTRMIRTLLTACPMAILLSVHISYTPLQHAVCYLFFPSNSQLPIHLIISIF